MTHKVMLAGTGIAMSRLGFGCSALVGPNTRADAIGLLEAAFEEGITHIDVARVYGSGDAEAIVGEFISRRRDAVTVTTKLGLQPPSGPARFARHAARRAMRFGPRLRRALGRAGSSLATGGAFDVRAAGMSLETSLRALRTDHVDLLLLHECRPPDCTEELLQFLQTVVRDGKVLAFGIGTDMESTTAICRQAPGFAGVVQIENSVTRPNEKFIRGHPTQAVISHGALAGLDALCARLAVGGAVLDQLAVAGIDGRDRGQIAALMLAYALESNPDGPVLTRSSSTEHISHSALVARAGPAAEQTSRFADVVSVLRSPTS